MSIEQIIILLLIGYIVFTIDTKQDNFPVPTVLVIIGIGLAFIPYFDSVNVTEDIIYHIFIPALLFISAYQFPIKNFRKNAGLIITLATAGIIVNVFLLGSLTWLIAPLGFASALVVAAILTPTDPVSVVSIIKQATHNDEIADIVEGESMLNDGTSIVLFTTLFSIANQKQSFTLLSFTGEFLLVSIGGLTIGLVLGYLVSKIIHYSHHRQYQIMLSIILAYGSFLIAEAIHVSGVLATVASGMMISYEYGRAIKEDHFRRSLDGFWDIVEISFLAILFLVIGIEITEYISLEYFLYAFAIFILMVFVRILIVYMTTKIIHPLSWPYHFLISWAGLKGSMSVFLILTLYTKSTNGFNSEWVVAVTFTTVLISLVIQSLSIAPISRKILK